MSVFICNDASCDFVSIPKPTDNFVELMGLFAATTGTIAVNIKQIPNQPTVFLVLHHFS